MSSIKTNFEFPRGNDPVKQGQRLAQDLSSNFKAIANQIQTTSSSVFLPVGTIIHSMLTPDQMFLSAGDGWVLADGRDVSGSQYATLTGSTNVPDVTGRFLRGKGAHNPDGDLPLGTYSSDKYGSHNHSTNNPSHTHSASGGGTVQVVLENYADNGTSSHTFPANHLVIGSVPPMLDMKQGGQTVGDYNTGVTSTFSTATVSVGAPSVGSTSTSVTTNANGSNETAPKAITVNVFIKIN